MIILVTGGLSLINLKWIREIIPEKMGEINHDVAVDLFKNARETDVNKFTRLALLDKLLTVYSGKEDQQRTYPHVQDSVWPILCTGSQLEDGEAYNVVGKNGRLQGIVDTILKHLLNVDLNYTEAEQLNQLSRILSDENLGTKESSSATHLTKMSQVG